MKVNVLEAKNRLSQLIKAAQAGEEVVIANRGVPVARLVPMRDEEDDSLGPPGSAPRILARLEKMGRPAGSRRSAEEVDAYIKRERDAWD